MFFIAIGYLIFVAFAISVAWLIILTLAFGGGDCGPLFGNWRPKGSLAFFIWLIIVEIGLFFVLWNYYPFNITVELIGK